MVFQNAMSNPKEKEKKRKKQGNNANAVNIVAQDEKPGSCNEGQER